MVERGAPIRFETDRHYRWVIVGLLLVVAASLSYFVLAARQADPDMFWHIASGRYIASHRSVPTTDVFSWYGAEHHLSWMPQSWLFDVSLFGAWRLGGFTLIHAIAALVGAAVAGLVYWLFALRSGNRLLALAAGVLAAAGILPSVAARPQMLTFVVLLVLALLLEHRKWWWAVPVVLLGVNLHGPLYPVYLTVVAYYTLPKRWPVLAACAVVVAVNPNGLSLIPYPFLTLSSGFSGIQEYAHVAPIEWPAYVLALLLLLVLLQRREVPLKELVGLVGIVVLSLAALRHMVFMFILAVPLVAPYLALPSQPPAVGQDGRERTAPDGAPAPSPVVASASPPSRIFAILDWTLLCVLIVGAVFPLWRAAATPVSPFRGYPEQASLYLKSRGITRYMNEYGDGGYLIFIGMRPLVDGRTDPFVTYPGGPEVTVGVEYQRVWYMQADCRPFLAKNGISHVMIHASSPLGLVLEQSRDFEVVYRDSSYVIYKRLVSSSASARAIGPQTSPSGRGRSRIQS